MEPICQNPLLRPKFLNVNIQDQGLWALDNAQALAVYWKACGNAAGLTDEDIEGFNRWLRDMHQREYVREMCAEELL